MTELDGVTDAEVEDVTEAEFERDWERLVERDSVFELDSVRAGDWVATPVSVSS